MQITRDAAAWEVACETTSVAAGSGEAAKLALLHDRLGDPVDARVAADRRVRRVDEDNLVVLVRGILHGGSVSGRKRGNARLGTRPTWLIQYEFSTRRLPQRCPTRSSALERRLRRHFRWLIPWCLGLP